MTIGIDRVSERTEKSQYAFVFTKKQGMCENCYRFFQEPCKWREKVTGIHTTALRIAEVSIGRQRESFIPANRRNSRPSLLLRVFVENIGRRVVAELEIHLFFTWVDGPVHVRIEDTVAETVGSLLFAAGGGSGAELIDLYEPFHQLVAGVDLKNAIRSRPILYGPAKLVLGFLGTSAEEQDDGCYK